MANFILKEIKNTDIKPEIENVGFDKSYINEASKKYIYKNIKIFDLTNPQIHILKQTAISVGADCATHREVITGKVEKSDCILGGSISQLLKISLKLKEQPFKMKELSEEIRNFCSPRKQNKTKIMGILNITPNSFSDGGLYNDFESAKKHLIELIEDKADIIDIGAESTKPYSKEVLPEEQLEKIIPILEFMEKNYPNREFEVSIDTRSAKVAEECAKYKVDYINDVSGLTHDSKMTEVIKNAGCKVIIQHSKGTPENMQNSPHYENLMDEIYIDLKNKADMALSNGIKAENIIIDPGIGFGKTRENNFEIIRRIEEFYSIGYPILLGISRKSLLNMKDAPNEEKDIYTLALNALALEKRVDIIRVHNVKIHKKLTDILSECK